jgi:hypothetical protein
MNASDMNAPEKQDKAVCGTPPFSTSESLADGLVTRLIDDWQEHDRQYWAAKLRPPGARGVPPLPKKRALGYRVLRERSIALIPPVHRLIVECHGEQDGMDKRAGFGVVHWSATSAMRRLEAQVTYGRPGWTLPMRWGIFTITKHTLQRLFYRLKVLDHAPVLAELESATKLMCTWYPVVMAYIPDAMPVGVPTPNGILMVKKEPANAPYTSCELVATTWVSNALVEARKEQAIALHRARAQGGLVAQIGTTYLALTPELNLDRFARPTSLFNDPHYKEMLRHLPLAKPLTKFVYG